MPENQIDQINAQLPQTQCTRCGYQGCKPYAKAIAEGNADINQCPPGGGETIKALADLLHRAIKPLNPEFGEYQSPKVAKIIEEDCIGCAKCLDACPVDAILGASKFMHTVIENECTGCELCLLPCPVDCIVMEDAAKKHDPERARSRYKARLSRLERLQQEKKERMRRQREVLKAKMAALKK